MIWLHCVWDPCTCVCEAGIMLVPEGRTQSGFELHFGVNYLGHFLLTWLLLDTLKDSGRTGHCSRVVTVSSSAHSIGKIVLNDLNSRWVREHKPSYRDKRPIHAPFRDNRKNNQIRFFCFRSLFSQFYSAHAAYCQSKLAQLVFSAQLQQELQRGGFPVTSCAVDPGVVNTALYQHLWTPLRLVHGTLAPWFLRVTLLLLFSPKKKNKKCHFSSDKCH